MPYGFIPYGKGLYNPYRFYAPYGKGLYNPYRFYAPYGAGFYNPYQFYRPYPFVAPWMLNPLALGPYNPYLVAI